MSGTRPPLGQALAETFKFYRENLRMVWGIAIVVAGLVNLLLGLGLGELHGHVVFKVSTDDEIVSYAGSLFVTIPLLTAMYARMIVGSRAGQTPTLAQVVSGGLDVFAPVLAVVLLYAVSVVIGLSAFFAPGLFFAVTFYFAPNAVAIEGLSPFTALQRSTQLVRGGWFHALGVGVVFTSLTLVVSVLIGSLVAEFAVAANSEALVVVAEAVAQAVGVPMLAIGSTMYFLRLRTLPTAV